MPFFTTRDQAVKSYKLGTGPIFYRKRGLSLIYFLCKFLHMAKCVQCSQNEASRGLLCESCVTANINRYQTVQKATEAPSINTHSTRNVRINPLLVIGILSMVILASKFLFSAPSIIPNMALQKHGWGYDRASCTGKPKCLIVLVAPWCPACHGSIPIIQAIRDNFTTNKDVGIQIISAMDSEDQLITMAEEIGGAVYLDTNREFSIAVGRVGVPAWWLIDEKRAVIKHDSGFRVAGNSHQELAEYFLKDSLGL